MRPASAADAVSLAIQRTREFLFRPFRWETYLKLGLVAIVTEGVGSNLRPSSHGGNSRGNVTTVSSPFNLTPEQVAVIVAAVLLAIVLSMVVFYLITRLRFAFFHCLVHNSKEIRPGWQLYRTHAMRFFWLNVLAGFCFMLLVVLAALPFVAGLWQVVHETRMGGHPNLGLVLSLVLPMIPIILLLILVALMADLILRDWMLPHFALDNATAGKAWSQVWTHIKAEKRQFLVYSLFRVVLPIIATIGLFFVLLIPGLILAGSVAAAEFGLHSAFAGSSGASAVIGVLLEVFFAVITFAFALLACICLGGPLSTGIREYALIFYGGRYQALGEALYPPPPPGPPLTAAPGFA